MRSFWSNRSRLRRPHIHWCHHLRLWLWCIIKILTMCMRALSCACECVYMRACVRVCVQLIIVEVPLGLTLCWVAASPFRSNQFSAVFAFGQCDRKLNSCGHFYVSKINELWHLKLFSVHSLVTVSWMDCRAKRTGCVCLCVFVCVCVCVFLLQ